MKGGRYLRLLNNYLHNAVSYIIIAYSKKSIVYSKYSP